MTTASPKDMWQLARENADVLRLSTLFTARQVPKYLSDDESIDRAGAWCREHGITHLYLECFRAEFFPPEEVLPRARDRFTEAGFLVSGCMTPASFGRHSNGWRPFSCYTSEETRRKLRQMSEYAAGLFDEVMIDDFLASDCTCPDCRRARGDRTWSDFKRELMLEMSRENIIEAGRRVNPDVQFIIKYPAWPELYQERGYDVAAQTELFPRIWVGTETRGVDPGEGAEDARRRLRHEPQYEGYWLMRWLGGIGAEKCGGGWYDTIETSPAFYVEQGRQTILGGAREAFLFNYGAIYEGTRYDRKRGPADMAALREELPEQFALARLVHGKRPRGLLGWKPPNSPPGPDRNLHPLLGAAGLPVTAAHEFDPEAPGFVFGYHVLHDPHWWEAVEQAMDGGRPIVVTPAFLRTARPLAEGNRLDWDGLRGRAVVVPDLVDPDHWPEVEQMPQEELDAMRDRACEALGLTFHAPHKVSLYLFDDDLAVVENFRNEPADCALPMDGWGELEPVLRIPARKGEGTEEVRSGAFQVPPRTLLAFARR